MIMTFDEWLATQDKCQPTDWSSMSGPYRFWIKIARRAWAAGYQEGAMFQRSEDRKLGGSVFGDDIDEDCLELTNDESNYDD